MWSNYLKSDARISTTVFSNINGSGEYGYENNVVIRNGNTVDKYDKERKTEEANGVDLGYFIVSKDSLDPNIVNNISFEMDILPSLIKKKQLGAYVTENQYYFITNLHTLKVFEDAAITNNFLPLAQKYFGV